MTKDMSTFLKRGLVVSSVLALLISITPTINTTLVTEAAAGDWKPNHTLGTLDGHGTLGFPHATGISRNINANVQPDNAGESTSPLLIGPDELAAGTVFDCTVDNVNNQLSQADNLHYYPDGLPFSSFNNYRNEWTNDSSNPPNVFFDSYNSDTTIAGEVERNYLGGAVLHPTPQDVVGTASAKDTVTITDSTLSGAGNSDFYMLAHVHNNASTALNPTTDDPRASLRVPGQVSSTATVNLSARATNTRTHFSVPSLAVPTGGAQANFVNRLRADNAYTTTVGAGAGSNPCVDYYQNQFHQISDISHIRNNASVPLTFVVTRGYIKNPFITADPAASEVDFSATGLHQLVDPTLNQSTIADQNDIAQLTNTQGAKISSGHGDTPNQPNQRSNVAACNPDITANQTHTNCNPFANPVRTGDEFDGQWYGSTEFTRYVGISVNAVEAQPELSINKSVRRVLPNEQSYTTTGPTSTDTQVTSGNGSIEYQVILQNTGNVDLDQVNFADLLPAELSPEYDGVSIIKGEVARCPNIAAAYSTGCTDQHVSIPLVESDSTIALSSSALGVTTDHPLTRDPAFITSGLSSDNDGEVLRITWRMVAACSSTTPAPVAHNYGLATASSSGIDATITSTNTSAFPQYEGSRNISEDTWESILPGAAKLSTAAGNPATNDTTVQLDNCPTPGGPELQIAKYVRRSSDPATSFGTGAVMTTVGDGEVEYLVAIHNSGAQPMAYLAFADKLPAELSFVSGSIETEVCTDAQPIGECTGATVQSVNDTAYTASNRILALDSSNFLPNSDDPLLPHQILRIRWRMSTLCTPYGQTVGVANNYALVFGATDSLEEATDHITIIPGAGMPQARPYNIDRTTTPTFSSLFPDIMAEGFNELIPTATNNVVVNLSNCPPPPPPTVKKYVSTTPVGASGTAPSSFSDADDVASAVDFGEQTDPYTVYYRVTVRNTGTADIPDLMLEDRFFFRNGSAVTPQNVEESIGSQLTTRTVGSGNVETSVTDGARKVIYYSAQPDNTLRFRIPTLRAGETLAFYYTAHLDPSTRTTTQYHRNKVQVCYPQTTPTGACVDGGSNVAFHQDHPSNNPLSISIIKKVNGHDADEASLTAGNDQSAVQVVNGDALHYEVTIRADSTNTAVVTGILLTDTIATLPNVTSISNVVLRTPRGECNVTAGCTIRADHINEDLATHRFDLGASDAPARLTYDAVAHYTDGGTFNQNIARAVPLNATPRQNPATIIVRNSTLTILKTVNGQDADTDSDAVTVNSGEDLNYVVTVTAPAGNASTVTGIVLSDDVLSLPNVTNVRTIRLTTPSGTCATPCTIASIGALASQSFDLAAGQHATLTYTATSVNTTATLSAHNVNTATATPVHTATNPGPVHNPATVFVRGTTTPHTDFRITKEANPEVVRDGDEVTYTILVEPRNSRNDEIDNLVLLITDDINETGRLEQGGVTFTYIRGSTRIRTSDASCDGEMNDRDGIRCEDVSADDEIRITYRVRVSAPGLSGTDIVVVDNTAKLRSDTPGVRIRDDDDAEVQVIAPPAPPEQERAMEITKNVDVRTVHRGDLAHYTITVHNPNDHDVVRTLTDTIGLNGGTVPGQNGGRVRFNPGSLELSGAQFSGSIDTPEGMVLIIPANGLVTINYTATGEPDANQRVVSLAPNTARLDSGEYATAFVELPKTGPEAMAMTAFSSLLASAGYYLVRRKKRS